MVVIKLAKNGCYYDEPKNYSKDVPLHPLLIRKGLFSNCYWFLKRSLLYKWFEYLYKNRSGLSSWSRPRRSFRRIQYSVVKIGSWELLLLRHISTGQYKYEQYTWKWCYFRVEFNGGQLLTIGYSLFIILRHDS